jgi:hypothetical protein
LPISGKRHQVSDGPVYGSSKRQASRKGARQRAITRDSEDHCAAAMTTLRGALERLGHAST